VTPRWHPGGHEIDRSEIHAVAEFLSDSDGKEGAR
jgi:predicted esterase